MWDSLFGAVGGVVGGMMQANAMESATKMQIKALEKQRQFVYDQLDPNKIGNKARQADQNRAQNRLKLQGVVDPELLKQRYDAEKQISDRLAGLKGDEADQVGSVAAKEAIAGTPGLNDIKSKLIEAAGQELNAGATLPPDVQAQLAQSGLEKTGQMSGKATTEGFGGNILRQIIGTAAIQLKADRQKRATELAQAAQDMDVKRQAILGSLFPNLASKAVSKLGATQSVLGQSNQMVPESGLGGTDIANLWLARVGATNQLSQSAADVAARGAIGQGAAIGNMIGAGASGAGSLLNAILNKPKKNYGGMSDAEFFGD
jgi:hypothetical protein